MTSNFEQLCETIARLRDPDGCPWDREQNHKSLTRYLLEETYEVLEAINTDDFDKLKEELGDLLLQIVLHSQLAAENSCFSIDDVAKAINDKMIARHPHVFSEQKLETSDQVLRQWEKLKDAEKEYAQGLKTDEIGAKVNGEEKSALNGVPAGMPALLKALKISEKAVRQGFEWEKEDDIWTQLKSELEEFKHETNKLDEATENFTPGSLRRSSAAHEELYLEMGDVLFTMVNIARWHKIDPEEALLLTIEKFKRRFSLMERSSSRPLNELTVSELDDLWRKAKEDLRQENSKLT